MKQCLKWPGTLAREVIKLVEDKAQGNPLMIKEIMITLAGKGKLVSTDASGEVPEPTPRSSASGTPKYVFRNACSSLHCRFSLALFCVPLNVSLPSPCLATVRLLCVADLVDNCGSLITLMLKRTFHFVSWSWLIWACEWTGCHPFNKWRSKLVQ